MSSRANQAFVLWLVHDRQAPASTSDFRGRIEHVRSYTRVSSQSTAELLAFLEQCLRLPPASKTADDEPPSAMERGTTASRNALRPDWQGSSASGSVAGFVGEQRQAI